jgi:anti-sigma B factor antagonist
MTESESRLRVETDGDITHVGFRDRNIIEEAAIQQIGDELTSLIENSVNPKLLIDFTNVEHLSSAALGTLITVKNKIRTAGGQLRLCSIDPQIYEVFVITKLNRLFQIHESAEEAVDSFQ